MCSYWRALVSLSQGASVVFAEQDKVVYQRCALVSSVTFRVE